MSRLHLTGLTATDPLGFLAAVGLLRVLTHTRTFGCVKLGWSDEPGWPAELVTEKDCDADSLTAALVAHMSGRAAFPIFSGSTPDGESVGPDVWNDIKVEPDLFRDWLVRTRPAATATAREPADFLSAFGSELVTARSSGDLKPTALHMTSARQQFLDSCRKLSASLADTTRSPRGRKPPAPAFLEALFGPWEYCDEFSALGMDPNTEAIYALTATAPGNEKPVSTRAAIWLAIESVPMFPCAPSRGRLHTRGFDRQATAFRWPVWTRTMTAAAVRTVLGVRALHTDPTGDEVRALGIRAVMESARITFGQGYGQLRPAVQLA